MNPLEAHNRILESLHQAALDDAHWPAASALIDEAAGVMGNSLTVSERVGGEVRVSFSGLYRRGERRQDLERAYFGDYYASDERRPRLISAPEGRLLHSPDLYTARELKASPAYNEGARILGSQNGLNVRFDGPDGMHILWCTADPVAPGGLDSPQLQLIEYLVPHVRQFVLVRQALAAAGGLGASLAGLLDNSNVGVLYLDRHGRVLSANDPALEILRHGDGLSDRNGVLHAALPGDNSRLRRRLKSALPGFGSAGRPASGSMTVQRPLGGPRLELHVHPVGGDQADFGGHRVAALVLAVDPASRPRIDPVRVAKMLGLTASEGRVSALLAEGLPVRDIAAATGYRESYVYWLLKQVYKKQGLSGQIALVQRILAACAFPRR